MAGITARTINDVQDDVAIHLAKVLYDSLDTNQKLAVSRAALDGVSMVWTHVGYAAAEPNDAVDNQYRHLWILAALFHAKMILHGVEAAEGIRNIFLAEVEASRRAFRGPGRQEVT